MVYAQKQVKAGLDVCVEQKQDYLNILEAAKHKSGVNFVITSSNELNEGTASISRLTAKRRPINTITNRLLCE